MTDSEDLLTLLSSHSYNVQPMPTDTDPENLVGKRIVYRWEQPARWFLGTIVGECRKKLAKKSFTNYKVQYDDGSEGVHKLILEYYYDSESVFSSASHSSFAEVRKRVGSEPIPHTWALVL